MPERPGFNPEKQKAEEAEAKREKLLPGAAKNLVEGGLTAFAIGEAKDTTNLATLLEKSLPLDKKNPTRDLFPQLGPGKELGGGEYAAGMYPDASAKKTEELLGELVTSGFPSEVLEQVNKRPLLAIRLAEIMNRELVGPEAALEHYREGFTKFYQALWDELLPDKKIKVPPMPEITPKQHEAFDKFRLLPVYLPKISEDEFASIKGFSPLNREPLEEPNDSSNDILGPEVERQPLSGQWLMFETISEYVVAEGNTKDSPDPIARALDFESRLGISWYSLHGQEEDYEDERDLLLVRLAPFLSTDAENVIIPTAEQWNASANILNHLKGEAFQFGSSRVWDWVDTALDDEEGLLIGNKKDGGLGALSTIFDDDPYGFRVAVVLKKKK